MKNLAHQIPSVIEAFMKGTIESVNINFYDSKGECYANPHHKGLDTFIQASINIYTNKHIVTFTAYDFAGDEISFLSDDTDKGMQALGMFMNNWNREFIKDIWGEGAIADHMQSKWNDYRQTYGADGVVRKFYSELSVNNRSLLNAYIAKHYA